MREALRRNEEGMPRRRNGEIEDIEIEVKE